MRYLDCSEGTFPWKIRQLLEGYSTAIDPAVVQVWHDLIGESPPRFSSEIQRAAFAILAHYQSWGTRNTWLIRMLMRLTEKKFLPPSFRWPRTRSILTQRRTSQLLPLVTLKKVTVSSETEQNESTSSLASDSEQYELMQAAYVEAGRDFKDKGAFIGLE